MKNVLQSMMSLVSDKGVHVVPATPLTEWQVAVVKRALVSFVKNRHGVRVEMDGSFTVITDLFRVIPESSRSEFMASYLKALLPPEISLNSIRIHSVCPCDRLHG